jgi:hypothetical protein
MAFLPPEIASLVAKHLPSRNDLRNLRFLNRIFNEAVRKELFRVVVSSLISPFSLIDTLHLISQPSHVQSMEHLLT